MKPSSWPVARAVARVTFLEILRDRVLYNVMLIAVLLLGLALLASQLGFVNADRVVLDVGVSATNLSCALLGIFLGASVLNREFERRTIHVALSHPVSRPQFLAGKYLGVALAVAVNWALLCGVFLLLYAGLADLKASLLLARLGGALGAALFLLLLQGWVAAALAMAFSAYSSTAVSALLALGCYLVGNNVSELQAIAARSTSPGLKTLAALVGHGMANFEVFNLKDKVTYDLPVGGSLLVWTALYAGLWIGIAILAASVLVRTKESV